MKTQLKPHISKVEEKWVCEVDCHIPNVKIGDDKIKIVKVFGVGHTPKQAFDKLKLSAIQWGLI